MLRETHCPLCSGNDTHAYHEDKHRQYLRCSRCCLVFVPTHWHLCHAAEKAQYDLHENSFGDAAYRAFLGRLAAPLVERVAPPASGLDFGCGPVAVLAAMLREAGYTVDTFDAYYARNADVFARRYDFICASEVSLGERPFTTFVCCPVHESCENVECYKEFDLVQKAIIHVLFELFQEGVASSI